MVDIYQCYLLLNNGEVLIGTTGGNVSKRILKDINEIKNQVSTPLENFKNVLEDTSEHVMKMQGTIRSIQLLSPNKCIILSAFGGINIYNLASQEIEIINQENSSAHSKKWRLLVIDENNFITVGNYGELIHWDISNNEVQKNFKIRDRHAFFCLDWLNRGEKVFLVNNYIGDCYLWKFEDAEVIEIDTFNLNRNLQKIALVDDYLISVNYSGKIYVYKKEKSTFKRVFEFRIRESQGNWVFYSQENEEILIGTNNNLFYLDKNFQSIKELRLASKQIIDHEGTELVLTNNSIVIPNFNNAKIPETLVDYKYKKISLVGDSQVGKTSFCNYLESGDGNTETSTVGTHVWSISHSKESEDDLWFDDFAHRILYFDLAGQKEEHFTYFPKISDSDIILLFFQGIKPETFAQAISYYKELSEKCPNTDFYFVQTFSEQRPRVFERTIKREFNAIGLNIEDHLIKISSKTGEGYDDYETKVLDKIEWENATAVFRLPLYDEIESIIHSFYRNGTVDQLTLKELKEHLNLDESRLNLIANSYYEQGFFEYIEEEKLILINNYDYAQIQSDIANLIVQEDGYASTNLIYQEVDPNGKNTNFIRNILEYYRNNNIGAIFKEHEPDKETFVFPRKLLESLEIPNDIKEILPINHLNFEYSDFEIKIEVILNFFSRYSLNLEGISKNEVLLKGDQTTNPTMIYFRFNIDSRKNCKMCSLGLKKVDPIDYMMEREIIELIHTILKDHIVNLSLQEANSFSLEEIEDNSEILKRILKFPCERPYLDFKSQLTISNKAEIAELIKDVIALTNMSFHNHNVAYMIVGIKEKNCEIKEFQNVSNLDPLEQQIAQRIEEYILYPPSLVVLPFNIKDVYKWQKDGEISNIIPFTADQQLTENNGKLLIIKLFRQAGKVCEIKKKISFMNNKNRRVDYDVADSWIRLGSHTFRISEPFREMIRNKG